MRTPTRRPVDKLPSCSAVGNGLNSTEIVLQDSADMMVLKMQTNLYKADQWFPGTGTPGAMDVLALLTVVTASRLCGHSRPHVRAHGRPVPFCERQLCTDNTTTKSGHAVDGRVAGRQRV